MSRPRVGNHRRRSRRYRSRDRRQSGRPPGVLAVCEPVLYGPSTAQELAAFERGRLSATAGKTAYDAILAAVADAQAGRIDAVATAPINKEAFAAAGVPWRGHTELLAHLTGARGSR